MKGIGRISGWKVSHRSATEIEWKQTHGKKTVAVWRVGLGGGKIGYEMVKSGTASVRTFKGSGSLDRALAAAKKYMKAHARG